MPLVIAVALAVAGARAHPRTPCRVCNDPIGASGVTVVHKGREVHVHVGECLEHWQAEPQRYFAALQPRAALFDEEALTHGQLRLGWLIVGVYVLAGLVCGAGCAYLAVSRGRSPPAWFLAGLVGNAAALLALTTLGGRVPGGPLGVPRGLRKVPTTRAPVRCSACGAGNHPSAGQCSHCHAALEPRVAAERGA